MYNICFSNNICIYIDCLFFSYNLGGVRFIRMYFTLQLELMQVYSKYLTTVWSRGGKRNLVVQGRKTVPSAHEYAMGNQLSQIKIRPQFYLLCLVQDNILSFVARQDNLTCPVSVPSTSSSHFLFRSSDTKDNKSQNTEKDFS